MKKEYVKPEMVMEEFISEICLQTTSGGGNVDQEVGGEEDDGFSNSHRGSWGDLWN